MINSSTTVTVNDTVLDSEMFDRVLSFQQSEDTFSRWVVRPVALLTAVAFGATVLFASAFFVVLALALAPFIALSVWALKSKFERDLEQARTVDEKRNERNEATYTDGQSKREL